METHEVGNSGRITQWLPRDKDEDTSNEKNTSKTAKEVEKDCSEPVRLGRRRCVFAIFALPSLSLFGR